MKKVTILIFSVLASAASFAQLVTPGSGVNYDLSTLSALDATILSFDGTKYILSEDLTISENDTLEITTSDTLFIDADIRIDIEGAFITDAGENNTKFVISSSDTTNPSKGIRFDEFSVGSIKNTEITYIGGLKVITEDFSIEDSYMAYNVSGLSSGSVIALSRGSAMIRNNTFYKNDMPAVGSAANANVSAKILNNWIEKNGQSNQNRPQINMGPTGVDTLEIINNTIIGDSAMKKSGGIGISNFIGAEINTKIEYNVIQNNRYGLTVAGANAYASIKGNIIEDNNIDNNPATGGSGISVNSSDDSQTLILRENKIRRNLWGITVIGQASVDLGTATDLGNNLFSDNGNNGEVTALYNNTPLDITAMGNCWIEDNENADSTEIEDVIFHEIDDATLGTVDFSNWSCGILSTESFEMAEVNLYPNPAQNSINVSNEVNFEVVEFFNISGQLLKTVQLKEGENQINFNLPQGLYLLNFSNKTQSLTKRLMIK